MIAPAVIAKVRNLLAKGTLSQRQIAGMTGVSRGTVNAIVNGKRRDPQPPRESLGIEIERPSGPPQRCPGCGGLVYMPCMLCHVRKVVAEGRVAKSPNRPERPLRLELADGARERYEQLHKDRTAALSN